MHWIFLSSNLFGGFRVDVLIMLLKKSKSLIHLLLQFALFLYYAVDLGNR